MVRSGKEQLAILKVIEHKRYDNFSDKEILFEVKIPVKTWRELKMTGVENKSLPIFTRELLEKELVRRQVEQ